MARPRLKHESILRIRHLELQKLTIFQLGVLVKLASMAAISPRPGYVGSFISGRGYSIEEVADILGTSYLVMSKVVEHLQNVGFIVFTDNGILITNWSRWCDTKLEQQREYMRRRRGDSNARTV